MTLTNVLLKDVAGYSDTKKVADASAGKRLLLKIYGEIHDVTDYSSRHPGGKLLLEQVAALDLPDATPLFESYHALVDAKTMRHVLKPMATGEKVPEMYSFEHDGFYATLRTRVSKHLRKVSGQTCKATGDGWVLTKSFVAFAIWVGMLVESVVLAANDYGAVEVCLCAACAGFMLLSWGFIMFHDASHFAVTGPAFDSILSNIWNACAFWDHIEWRVHHVIFHHSFTGYPALDPDMHHGSPVMRTHEALPKYGAGSAYMLLGPPFWQFFGMLLVPGMYFGQIIQYNWMKALPQSSRQLWTLDMSKIEFDNTWSFVSLWVVLWFSALAIKGSLFVAVAAVSAYFLAANVTYSINIFADHDAHITDEASTAHAKHCDLMKKKPDWGETQVVGSANWGGPMWSFVFGGINMQIEHHLFPRISHKHFHTIAPIVRATCQEFNVEYNHFPTWWAAVSSVWKQVCSVHSACARADADAAVKDAARVSK